MARYFVGVGAALLGGMMACGGDEGGSQAPGAEAGASAAASYIVHTALDAPTGRLNYFVPAASLAADGTVDLSKGLEIPGVARLYAPPQGGFFAVGSSADVTITRFDLSRDGRFTETGVLSFQNQGINNLSRTVAFISETKAYYLDEANVRIIIWNPRDLTLTGSIDLGVAAQPGMNTKFVRVNYPLRAGRLYTTATWSNRSQGTLALETGLLVIDTERDTLAHYEVDTRCPGASEVVSLPSGDVYFGTGPDEVDHPQVRGRSRPACLLRVKAGEERFDPGYVLQVSDSVGGRVACDVLPSGRPEAVLVRVLDESKSAWSPANDEVGLADAWEWWHLDVQTGAAARATELGVASVYTTYSRVEGQVLLTRKLEGGADSQFFEVRADGGVRPGLRAPGFLWAAVKVY
jgi:hypothetical protein